MPWAFPILSRLLARFRPTRVDEDEEATPRPALPGAAKDVAYLEGIAGEPPENHGTYQGPRTGKLYAIYYWPVWASYSIHHAEEPSMGYVAVGKWYPDLESAQADVQRVL